MGVRQSDHRGTALKRGVSGLPSPQAQSAFHTVGRGAGGGGSRAGSQVPAAPAALTLSLCRASKVNHRAMAQRCPLVTAFTPCGFSVPEENPTALPHWGCTSAWGHKAGHRLWPAFRRRFQSVFLGH